MNCSLVECDRGEYCRGWCRPHYERWLKTGDTFIPEKLDVAQWPCSKCDTAPRRMKSTGKVSSWCQDCTNTETRRRNEGENGTRWFRYGLTKSQVDEMILSQSNCCAICHDPFEATGGFHIDHDNACCPKEKVMKSGACGDCVRALLCGSCNQGLGNFKDSSERLTAASTYMEKWNENNH